MADGPPYGIGLLGCGRISENHLQGYRDPRDLGGLGEIVALCDFDSTKRRCTGRGRGTR
jgi:hypothetical protein